MPIRLIRRLSVANLTLELPTKSNLPKARMTLLHKIRTDSMTALVVALTSASQLHASPGASGYSASVPAPTLSNVAYGEHARQVLDVWQAESVDPSPLVVVIHGGSWKTGQKEWVNRFVDVNALLEAGVSVAAINYRYTTQAGDIQPPVAVPMGDAARAVQFIRSKANEWNLDKTRIAGAGASAGACTVLWLALHEDMAQPNSYDPVARESTRLWCAATINAQTSLDPKQMKEWTPNSRYGAHAFGLNNFTEFLAERERILPWITEYSPYSHLSDNDPPLYLFYKRAPALGQEQEDPTHSANFGVTLKEVCDAIGVSCELAYTQKPEQIHTECISDFLIKYLFL
jgi:acetyl esterase/lipase